MIVKYKPALIVVSLLGIFLLILFGLGDALHPLLLSFGLVYLLFPIVKKLENKGISRNIAVSVVFGLVVLMTLTSLALVVPGLVRDIQSFLKELPQISTKAIQKIELLAEKIGLSLDLSRDAIGLYIKEHASLVSGGFVKSLSNGLKISFIGASRWLVMILNLFLVPLFFFYVLNDYEKLSSEIKSFIPKTVLPKLSHYMDLSNTVLSGYVRGQLIVALLLSVLYALGLALVGLKFGILIGLLSGLLSIIPYAGFFIGFITAIIVSLANFVGLDQIFGIVVVFAIVQGLEGFVITPKLVGDKVGLSAFATMLALIIAGNLFGFVGMLIAIPAAAIMKSIISELKIEYQKIY